MGFYWGLFIRWTFRSMLTPVNKQMSKYSITAPSAISTPTFKNNFINCVLRQKHFCISRKHLHYAKSVYIFDRPIYCITKIGTTKYSQIGYIVVKSDSCEGIMYCINRYKRNCGIGVLAHIKKKTHMKTMRFIFAVLIALQLSCSVERNEVIINGQFLGEHPEEIKYTYPVNGTSFDGFVNRVKLDSLGHFQINLQVYRPALITFRHAGSAFLIIEPGNKYEISLNQNKNNVLEMGGSISETQKVYSSFPHQHPMSCLYSYGEEFTNYNSIKQNLNDDLQNEISILNELYEYNKISKDVLNLLVTDRKIYYYTAQSVLASRNHLTKKSKNEEVTDEIFSIWREAAHGVSLDNELLLSSYYSYDFLEMYLWYKIYTTFDYDSFVELRAENRDNRTTHAHNIDLAKKFLSNGNLEFYIAGTFFHQNMRRQYDDNLISIYKQFKSDFPESNYIPFVEKTLENMIEKQQEQLSGK